MIDLAILWHMHQPVYRDPRTADFVLPWVRLHASRAYYDMARILGAHPQVKVHVNLVPSLLEQLEAYQTGRARDQWLDLSEKPADQLDLNERALVWSRFFMVDWQTEVEQLPRYRELLLQRGKDLAAVDLARLARDSQIQDLLDLQTLFNLAWTGFALRAEDESLRELLARGRTFREADKQVVLQAQRRAIEAVVPLYRALEERGQIELTSTPYYHPILPLVIDSDSARQGLPQAQLPTRFAFPEDAQRQVESAIESHRWRFGKDPRGMWPAEGSVSPAAATLFAQSNIRWVASDEEVLLRSLGGAPREAIHQSYQFETSAGPLAMVFRDRGLSDLIGFRYANLPAEAAVADLLSHLHAIGEGSGAEVGSRKLVTLVLDGENPWEHYPQSGRLFLDELYRALAQTDSGVRTVRLSEALPERPHRPLPQLHTGSWIDANFRIWIGHPEDVRAWEALGKVRRELDQAPLRGVAPAALERARQALLVAEGSDWFWWYGDDFTTDNAAEFDGLFRGYLSVACEALGIPEPPELATPISAAARRAPGKGASSVEAWTPPTSLLRPLADGELSRFGEWQGAGQWRASRSRGAMAQSQALFGVLRFGFDAAQCLWLRLDSAQGSMRPHRLELELELPAVRRLSADLTGPGRVATAGVERWGLLSEAGEPLGSVASGAVLVVQVPLAGLGLAAGDLLKLAVVLSRNGVELQRLPSDQWLRLVVPTAEFDQLNWKV